MIFRIAGLFFIITLIATVVQFWFVIVCVLAAVFVFGASALFPAIIVAVSILLLRGMFADIRNRYCDVLIPRFRDLYVYRHHAVAGSFVRAELSTTICVDKLHTLMTLNVNTLRLSLYTAVVFLIVFAVFPSVFLPAHTPITVFIPIPDSVNIGSSVNVGAYSPERQTISVYVNGEKVVSQYGTQLRHTLIIREETHVVVTADSEKKEKTIHVREILTLKNLKIAIVPPSYIRVAGVQVPDGYAVRGSVWSIAADAAPTVKELIITNGTERRYMVLSSSVRFSFPLNHETVALAIRDTEQEYTIGTYTYTLLDDYPPKITVSGAVDIIYYTATTMPFLRVTLSDDWGIASYSLRVDDRIILTEKVKGTEYNLEHSLNKDHVSNGATIHLDLTDIKGQTSSVMWTLRFISEDVRNERLSEYVEQLQTQADNNDSKLSEMTDTLQRTIDAARLQGDVTKEQKESLHELQEHIADMQKMLEESLPLLDKDQERYVREIAMPELKSLAQEIAELLKTTNINEIRQRSEKLEKKMDSVAQSLKNFRDALVRMKKAQELNALIADIEKASHEQEIREKLGDFLKKNPDPMIEHAASTFAENKNKQQLLDSLKSLRDLMSGKANDEMKEIMTQIAGEAIVWSERFEERIRNGSVSSSDIIAMKDMLDTHSTLINTMGAGMLYVSPGVIYTLSELHTMLDRIRTSGQVQYKPLYDMHIVFITHVLKTLAQAEQRSQQLDAGQMAQMLKDILGEQQSITKDSGTPQEGQDGSQMSDSLQKRQQELADTMGEIRKRSDGGTQQRAGTLEEEMRKSAEEKDVTKKKGQSKVLELKLEKFISDIQNGDPSEKRKRELAERLLTGKQKTNASEEEWKKKVREFRKQNNDKEFGYEIDRYYRRLLDK